MNKNINSEEHGSTWYLWKNVLQDKAVKKS